MNFNSIPKSKKLQIIADTMPVYEEIVYSSLIYLGIDPESFDPEDYSIETDDATALSNKNNLIKALEVLSVFNSEIEKNS
jgi:hypothetical protein